jgi:hypothetical protein
MEGTLRTRLKQGRLRERLNGAKKKILAHSCVGVLIQMGGSEALGIGVEP